MCGFRTGTPGIFVVFFFFFPGTFVGAYGSLDQLEPPQGEGTKKCGANCCLSFTMFILRFSVMFKGLLLFGLRAVVQLQKNADDHVQALSSQSHCALQIFPHIGTTSCYVRLGWLHCAYMLICWYFNHSGEAKDLCLHELILQCLYLLLAAVYKRNGLLVAPL